VIECERGFRASHAYPRQIYVPVDVGDFGQADWEDVSLGLCRYGVPVELLAGGAAEATRVLAQGQAA
jgi:hypothetical protein